MLQAAGRIIFQGEQLGARYARHVDVKTDADATCAMKKNLH